MAVSDVHYGYEINRRQQGALFPLWGRGEIEARLQALLEEHRPDRCIVNGDFVDAQGNAWEAAQLLARLRRFCPRWILVRGNHDRRHQDVLEYARLHREPGFLFHHGHEWHGIMAAEQANPQEHPPIHITGHEHPSFTLQDGAGLRLKLPALVQRPPEYRPGTGGNWVMPAFSPWAAGGRVNVMEERVWVCGKNRVWRLH